MLALLSLLAWRRSGRLRLAMVGAGFLVFSAAGAATTWGLYQGADPVDILTWQTVAMAAGLLVVYLAAVKQ